MATTVLRTLKALMLVPLPILVFSHAQAAPPRPADVEKRVEAILRRMTLEEKVDYIGGYNAFYVRAVKRLGLPALKMADGPIGVRNYGPSTAYAAGIALAASWDTDLAGRVGAMIGRDARARGVHFLLGPGVNIHRAPMCGRNFEYYGEDPFLAARTAVAYIKGVQAQGVSATIKHFLGNNSEVDRHHTSSEIDERTLREIYLPTFEAAVKEAGVGAIMNSYNLVNGVHATQNPHINVDIAKKEWGFDGVMMSDWDATYDAVAAANAGLDLEMPSGKFMNRATLIPAVREGKVSVATIDDKVRRILRKAVQFGWLDREQTDRSWPLFSEEGRALALESARAGMVLLKNDGGLLPLDKAKLKTVAVIGPDAYPAVPVGGGSAQVRPFSAVSYLQGIADHLGGGGGGATVLYNRGVVPLSEIFDSSELMTATSDGQPGLKAEYFTNPDFEGAPALTRVDEHVSFVWDRPNGWPAGGPAKNVSARWSGYFVPAISGGYRFVAATYGLDDYRVYVDGNLIIERAQQNHPIAIKEMTLQAGRAYAVRLEYVHHDHHARLGFGVRKADLFADPDARALAARADAVIVLAGFDPSNESEGYDRTFELPIGQDDLIDAVARTNKRTVVVMTSGGAVDMSRWLGHVPALMQVWYAGQEAGVALAQLLFGDVSPSGKLPVSFERHAEDSATYKSYYPGPDKKIVYSEGVFLGYRHFDKTGIKPLFPFGYGLSYTTFKYGGLAVTPDAVPAAGGGTVTVSFDVTNSGRREGAEVAQLYVADQHAALPRPPKELKGFAKLHLKPGETRRVQIALDRRAFSYFDPKLGAWRADPGEFQLLVGSSSQAIELRGKVSLR
jgi:beta-glucosidase